MLTKRIEALIGGIAVLVVDDNTYTRKLLRMMLMNLGVKTVYEASDGVAALDLIRTVNPDIVLLDWIMPVLNGPQLMRIVRSPGIFPNPDVPVILLTADSQRSRVNQAIKLGVNEFLVKPVSPKALYDRLVSILLKPRPMVKIGEFYVPLPRMTAAQSQASGRSEAPAAQPERASSPADVLNPECA